MKYLLPLILLFSAVIPLSAREDTVVFKFAARTIPQSELKTTMERQVSALLSAIDEAAQSGGAIDFAGIDIDPKARGSLSFQWEELGVPFRCLSDMYVSPCLHDTQGYQVRNIKIEMLPRTDDYDGSPYREFVVYLDKTGRISDAKVVPEDIANVEDILANGSAVGDMSERYELLKFVEDFRCYYTEKNIEGLELIFSDDALIISGNVIRKAQNLGNGEVRHSYITNYKSSTKEEYLNSLRQVFRTNKRINVEFDDIKVVKNPAKEGFYGVTLHQSWKGDRYADEGWVFLYWDFTNPDEPQIMVRTWQVDEAAEKDGVFTISDFQIN